MCWTWICWQRALWACQVSSHTLYVLWWDMWYVEKVKRLCFWYWENWLPCRSYLSLLADLWHSKDAVGISQIQYCGQSCKLSSEVTAKLLNYQFHMKKMLRGWLTTAAGNELFNFLILTYCPDDMFPSKTTKFWWSLGCLKIITLNVFAFTLAWLVAYSKICK